MAEDKSAPGDAAADPAPAEPGAPIPADAVDPELLRLPLPRLRRSPVLAVAVILLCGLVLYRLRGDLQYGLAGSAPVDLGDARAAEIHRGDAGAGRFVS